MLTAEPIPSSSTILPSMKWYLYRDRYVVDYRTKECVPFYHAGCIYESFEHAMQIERYCKGGEGLPTKQEVRDKKECKKPVNTNVLDLLRLLRSLDKNITYNAQHGRCFQIYQILKIYFPLAEPWYNHNHIITKIDDHYYDVTGLVTVVDGYYHLTDRLMLERAPEWGEKEFGNGQTVNLSFARTA